MEEFAIGANLESAAARGNERKRLDALAEFENFGRQTDGLRRVVSNDAVFDRHLGFHFELLSKNQAIGTSKRGQDSVEAPKGFEVTFLSRADCCSDGRRSPLQQKNGLAIAHGRRRFGSFWRPAGAEQHRENDEHLRTRRVIRAAKER